MAFTTAVFYDIENLLKGYAFSAQTLSELSLRDILEAASGTGRLSSIAVQRAYANWSDARLGVMRGEINELGIEPVQVFGLSKDPKKNAADIQLAIDAIDLAHVRPSIDVFVIVSGDGGFSALAKKLHEYGKTVIGCAYPSSANRVFQAVCDEFVSITDPDDARLVKTSISQSCSEQPQITTPLVLRMARAINRAQANDRPTVVAKAKEVLGWIENDDSSRSDLGGQGLHLSIVGEAIRHGVPNFEPSRVGFAKFVEFLQYACAGTSLHVLRFSDTAVTLAYRSCIPPGAVPLPDIGEQYLHSAENYRSVLRTGPPIFRLPDAISLNKVATWIAQNPPRDTDLGTSIETVTNALDGIVTAEAAKRALLCFISAGIFDRRPNNLPLGEQRLSLSPELATDQAIVDTLKGAARKKIEDAVSEVQEAPFAEILQTGA